MPERALEGSPTTQLPIAEQGISRKTEHLTAFVGRTLRGPLHSPVTVRSFAEYQQVFGDLWQPSPLSYAVEQFFEQGGRAAVIVRVANGALPVSLKLRAGDQFLHLEARAPGTREFLRASVDYDHIAADDLDRFNLVVQRLRSSDSPRIEVQETFRYLSIDPESPRYVPLALAESTLVRVRGDVPRVRPDRTIRAGTNLPVGYVGSNPDGDDGKPLTDYDVIGSAERRTGLFALTDVEGLAYVYIPPLTRTVDVGVKTLLVALTFCLGKRALLIVDPPASWTTPELALLGRREFALHSDVALMFFPRVSALDRVRGRMEIFPSGALAAGILSRAPEDIAALAAQSTPELVLRAGVRLAAEVSAAHGWRLAAEGINTLSTVRSRTREWPMVRTLACGASTSAVGHDLAQRRFALAVVNAIERATRWCRERACEHETWARAAQQVRTFLHELHDAGAFSGVHERDALLVICDDRINDPGREQINILVQFPASRPGMHHSYMITHTRRYSSVRRVVVNQLQAALVIQEQADLDLTAKLYVAG